MRLFQSLFAAGILCGAIQVVHAGECAFLGGDWRGTCTIGGAPSSQFPYNFKIVQRSCDDVTVFSRKLDFEEVTGKILKGGVRVSAESRASKWVKGGRPLFQRRVT